MRILMVLLLGGAAPLMAGDPGRPRITIEMPRGWTEDDPAKLPDQHALRILREDPARGKGQVLVRYSPLDRELTVDQFADLLRQGNTRVRKENPDLEVLNREKVVSLNGKQFVTSAVQVGEEAILYYHLVDGRRVFTLGGSFPVSRLAAGRRVMEELARGFSVDQDQDQDAVAANQTLGPRQAPPDRRAVDPRPLLQRGHRLAAGGDHEGAIAAYEEALALEPPEEVQADILYRLSSEHLEAGIKPYLERRDDRHYRKSLERGKQCLTLRPGAWLPMGNIGTAHMNLGELEEAQRWLDQAEKAADRSDPRYRQLVTHQGMVKGLLQVKRQKPAARPR